MVNSNACFKLRLLLALALFTASAQLSAATEPPPWRTLEYHKEYFWVKASTTLSLKPVASGQAAASWVQPANSTALKPQAAQVWQLAVVSAIASNQEKIVEWLDPQSFGLYQRSRLSEGKEKRFKNYRFLAQGVHRLRRAPVPGEESKPSKSWSQTTAQTIPYPAALAQPVALTSPQALLAIASMAPLAKTGDSWRGYIYTDLDFFEATLTVSGTETVPQAFTLTAKTSTCRVKANKTALVVDLSTRYIGDKAQEDAFDLLGMTGKISILVDTETRLPVRLRGVAPRLGYTNLDLAKASSDRIAAPCKP